jgi:hypothetical protein
MSSSTSTDAHRAHLMHARSAASAGGWSDYMSDETGRIKEFLEFERIESVSDSMRELIDVARAGA